MWPLSTILLLNLGAVCSSVDGFVTQFYQKAAAKESQQFLDKIFEILATSTSIVSVNQIRYNNIKEQVDLCSGCDSDVTSNKVVAMREQYYCEIIAFLQRHYYRFQFVLPRDFDNIFFEDFRQNITQRRQRYGQKVKIISTLLRQLAMILAMKIFASDGQR